MSKITFAEDAWTEYLYWQSQDKKTLKKINSLLKSIQREPFTGEGKPEPLKNSPHCNCGIHPQGRWIKGHDCQDHGVRMELCPDWKTCRKQQCQFGQRNTCICRHGKRLCGQGRLWREWTSVQLMPLVRLAVQEELPRSGR